MLLMTTNLRKVSKHEQSSAIYATLPLKSLYIIKEGKDNAKSFQKPQKLYFFTTQTQTNAKRRCRNLIQFKSGIYMCFFNVCYVARLCSTLLDLCSTFARLCSTLLDFARPLLDHCSTIARLCQFILLG